MPRLVKSESSYQPSPTAGRRQESGARRVKGGGVLPLGHLVARATYLPEDYLRLRLRFAKPRYQLIATATYLHSVTVQRLG
jgi:hypothetical protein